jgi:cystathionine beta-lyase
MTTNFVEVFDRRATDSIKWNFYAEDVLPLWVADTDFKAAAPVIQALLERVEQGIFGYGGVTRQLREVICARLERLYAWKVNPDEIALIPGVISGFNLACQAFAGEGLGVAFQTPAYMPFLTAPGNAGSFSQDSELVQDGEGRYTVDFDRFAGSLDEKSRVFILCNPHNPVGRVWSAAELERMGEICLERKLVICSDEIHSDLLFNGHKHIPIASLNPELAQQSITLMSPSKSFNLPGLYCSFAVIQNEKLRNDFNAARRGLVSEGNLLGFTAAEAAYRLGEEWLAELMVYLEGNRDAMQEFIKTELPELRMLNPEGTYLAWIDCRGTGLGARPGKFFLKQARVGLNEGSVFGKGGEGFVRLNFGCPRSTLMKALEQMKLAMRAAVKQE